MDKKDFKLFQVESKLGVFYVIAHSFDEAAVLLKWRLEKANYGYSSGREASVISCLATEHFFGDSQLFSSENANLILINEDDIVTFDEIDDTDDGQPVDLGLPSGTLWMKSNVGATKPSGFGKFFQWGDTQGYDGVDEHQFNWDNYKFGGESSLIKYNSTDRLTLLESSDDSAFVATGGQISIPTKEQFQELIDNTEHRWLCLANGVKGMKFTNKKDDTKYIFIPAAGDCYAASHDDVGSWGSVWSASRDESYADLALGMSFYAGDVYMGSGYRCSGYSVRAVVAKNI